MNEFEKVCKEIEDYGNRAYEKGRLDILCKIRAEIEDERIDIDLDLGEEVYYNKAIDDVLQIIDKYKGAGEC